MQKNFGIKIVENVNRETMSTCTNDSGSIYIDIVYDIKNKDRFVVQDFRRTECNQPFRQQRPGCRVTAHFSAWSVIQLARKAMLRGDHKKIEW